MSTVPSRLPALLAAHALFLPPALARAADPTPASDAAEPSLESLTLEPPDASDRRVLPVERPFDLIEVPPLDENVLVIIERDTYLGREQMHPMPVPLPFARLRDKGLHSDRGMLAAGVIFTAICSAGAGLALTSIIIDPNRYYGQDSRDAVAAFTGLLGCTASALALATTGAKRLKKRRGR